MSLSKKVKSPFQMEWRKCLVEHFRYLDRQEDYGTMISFYTLLAKYNLKKVVTISKTGHTPEQLEQGITERNQSQLESQKAAQESKKAKAREKNLVRSATKRAEREALAEKERLEKGIPEQLCLFD